MCIKNNKIYATWSKDVSFWNKLKSINNIDINKLDHENDVCVSELGKIKNIYIIYIKKSTMKIPKQRKEGVQRFHHDITKVNKKKINWSNNSIQCRLLQI